MLILIAGNSGSGKTYLANQLKSHLGSATIVSGDDFKKEKNIQWISPLNPRSNKIDDMRSIVETLVSGKSVFLNGRTLEPADYIIVDSLHALYMDGDIRIFLDPDSELNNQLKIEKDLKYGKTKRQSQLEIAFSVYDLHKYILPQREKANIIVTPKMEDKIKYSVFMDTALLYNDVARYFLGV